MESQRHPLPPFTLDTALQKVQAAEDAWNTRDPEKVCLAYTIDTEWRNRTEFINGREAVKAFLVKKGVAANSIKTEGRGSSEPVTTLSQCPARLGAKLSSCLAPDRRITITVE